MAWIDSHPLYKNVLECAYTLFMSTLSALIFAFGFKSFMNPGLGVDYPTIVAGGASGVSQTLIMAFRVFGWTTFDESLMISILYFVINVPLFILAFFGIGKRFAIFTIINVIEVSLFVDLLDPSRVEMIGKIAEFVRGNGGLLARVLFAAVCTGLSSAITFVADISAGGTDVISYYIGIKKKSLVGRYGLFVNGGILIAFTTFDIIHSIQGGGNTSSNIAVSLSKVFFTVLYFVITMIIIDAINTKNQKIKVEIISSNPNIGKEIVAKIPHAATLVEGFGVYSGMKKYIFTMVVSRYELKLLLQILKEIDDAAFIEVEPISSVFGRFHTRPVK